MQTPSAPSFVFVIDDCVYPINASNLEQAKDWMAVRPHTANLYQLVPRDAPVVIVVHEDDLKNGK